MKPYKAANIKQYSRTRGRDAFRSHPSKLAAVAWFRRNCRRFARPHERILDIGGGTGVWTDILQDEGIALQVYSVDISMSMLKERSARDRSVCGDMEELPFADGVFDRAFFFAALHHVENPREALAEAKRVVRNGGHVVLTEPTSLRLLLRRATIEPASDIEFRFSYSYLLRMLREVGGFHVVYRRHKGLVGRVMPIRFSATVRRWLNAMDDVVSAIPGIRMLAALGTSVTIVAEKIGD